ncbi:MAG: cysteine hydrolase [Clostridiales bacterium]|nr:cysteine hydrolase [Clostridiales bacterium]
MKRALLIIDVQKIYALEESSYFVEDSQSIVKNINRLIDNFYNQNEMIVYIKHEHTPDGSDSGRMFDFAGEAEPIEFKQGSIETEFIDGLSIIKNAPVIVKKRYDAFLNTDLDKMLKEKGIEKVVICGFMTNFCCESTARHAHDIDYFVDFVIDAMGTPGTELLSSEEATKATIANITSGFAVVSNTADI